MNWVNDSIDILSEKLPLRFWFQRWVEIPSLLSDARLPRGASILEIGCGSGRLAAHLSRALKPKTYVAIDNDPAVITQAEKRAEGNTKLIFQVADAAKLPFEDGQFDAVIVMETLHQIAPWKKVLREIHRVLKKKGKLILRDYSVETFTMPGVGFVMEQIIPHSFETLFDQVELLTHVRKTGFDLLSQNDNPLVLSFVAQKGIAH